MFKVILKKKAREFYLKADQSLAKKLARCFEILERAINNNYYLFFFSGARNIN